MIPREIQAERPDRQCFQDGPRPGERGSGVLVIEDDQRLRRVLSRDLRRRGFTVWEAADGAKGMELFRQNHGNIAVVLSDVRMPVLDGPHALDAMRDMKRE